MDEYRMEKIADAYTRAIKKGLTSKDKVLSQLNKREKSIKNKLIKTDYVKKTDLEHKAHRELGDKLRHNNNVKKHILSKGSGERHNLVGRTDNSTVGHNAFEKRLTGIGKFKRLQDDLNS